MVSLADPGGHCGFTLRKRAGRPRSPFYSSFCTRETERADFSDFSAIRVYIGRFSYRPHRINAVPAPLKPGPRAGDVPPKFGTSQFTRPSLREYRMLREQCRSLFAHSHGCFSKPGQGAPNGCRQRHCCSLGGFSNPATTALNRSCSLIGVRSASAFTRKGSR